MFTNKNALKPIALILSLLFLLATTAMLVAGKIDILGIRDIIFTSENPDVCYQFTIITDAGGTIPTGMDRDINGLYKEGAIIQTITPRAMPGYKFVKWTSSNGGAFDDEYSLETRFTMPGNDVVITAIFAEDDKPAENNELFLLTIKADIGGVIPAGLDIPSGLDISPDGVFRGLYREGETIKISALARLSYKFNKWTSSNGGVFIDENNSETEFVMPGNDAVITATFAEDDKHMEDEELFLLTIKSGTGGFIPAGLDVPSGSVINPDGVYKGFFKA
ncbi:MAG: hypothetical protein LBI03_00230 [Clostridiales bacterium]|nr:hypothetical protein [Clostridiales bacterium]